MFSRSSVRQFALTSTLAGVLTLGGGFAALAQDAATDVSQPSHIHIGTCADLDPNPAAPLNNLTPIGVDPEDEDAEAPDSLGVLTASSITHAESDEVELEWDTMLETSHAIAVHESEANIQNYVACGDIGGVVFDDDGDQMVIALHPMNDSGYSGLAFLSKDGDGNVDVEVYLAAPAGEADAPVATPAN